MEGEITITSKMPSTIVSLLKKNNEREVTALFEHMDFHEIAELIFDIGGYYRRRVFRLLHPDVQASVILTLNRQTRRSLLRQLAPQTIARFLHFTDEDDAVDVLQLIPQQIQEQVSSQLQETKRQKIQQLLSFDPETAGGIMDLNFILVKISFSVQEVLDKVNHHVERTKQVPVVVVTDEHAHVIGAIPFKNLLGVPLHSKISSLTHFVPTVQYSVDQEFLVKKIKGTHNDILVVIDANHHPIGIVHPHDLLRVLEQEATEDLYKFAGVGRNEHVFDSVQVAVRYRYKWLILNLGTALLAAFVISLFQDTIASLVVLAAYMPVVAGMGGNAGTQTLAVVVRGIALGEVRPRHGLSIIKKEIAAGFVNGIIVGVIVAFFATLLHGDPRLGFILGLSLICNLVIAGAFGALVPLTLRAFKLDPALSSSVFLTTATDVFGFLIFLGLATILLM